MNSRTELELIDLTMSSRSTSMDSVIDITDCDDALSTLPDNHPAMRMLAMTREQARQRFDNKRVIFAGDESIRTLFRDMARLLEDGNRMSDADVNIPMSNYTAMPGEICRRRGGQAGDRHFYEVRMYRSPPPSTATLCYVYVNGLRSAGMRELIDSLEDESFDMSFDLLIFSSFESDMRRSQLATPSFTFAEHFLYYILQLQNTLSRLERAARYYSATCLLVWMSSCSSEWSSTMADIPLDLDMLYSAVNAMATHYDFRLFNRWMLCNAYHSPFKVPETGQMTAMGLRLITAMICEGAKVEWETPMEPFNRNVSPPIDPRPWFHLDQDEDDDVDSQM